ncbi:hypothetical protein [Sulfuracidifex metallicus]|uniref:hypothetical protein n=1 Tax=Sulfuracidifex metallicus TaxID=47303 RepID=UPI003F6F2C64
MEGGDDSRRTEPGGFKETTPPLFFPPMDARALEWEGVIINLTNPIAKKSKERVSKKLGVHHGLHTFRKGQSWSHLFGFSGSTPFSMDCITLSLIWRNSSLS